MLALPPYREPDYLDLTGLRQKEEDEIKLRKEFMEVMKVFSEAIEKDRQRTNEMLWRMKFNLVNA